MNPFAKSSHPYYVDPPFMATLPNYKTAWSPTHSRYVGIRATWRDPNGVPVISAHVQGAPADEFTLFRATELVRYVL